MKKHLLILVTLVVAACSVSAQVQYQVLAEQPNEKTLKGLISRELLEGDSSFTWFAANKKGYTPNTEALAALRQYRDSIQIIAFMGTWCEDSHLIIPRFFTLLDASGFDINRLTLIGTDRNKKTLSHLSEALNVNNVPTLIVMKNGKEMGRVIEYGKTGMWDKELGEVISSAFAK